MADELTMTDAPVEPGADTGDSGLEGSPTVGEIPGREASDESGSPDESEGHAGPFQAIENGRLSAAAKASIEKLRAENPQLARAVQRALFSEDRLRRELPGGFKEIQELRGRLEQLGGDEGIQEFQHEMDGWREFDNLYTAGDPKVLEFLTETPEAQAAFLKIAPVAFEKFREAHPEGYSAYVSQVFVADMVANQIPLLVERLGDFIPADNPKAAAIVKQLGDYINRIGGMAQKQPAPPASSAAAPKVDNERQQFERERTEFTRQSWGQASAQKHSTLYQQAWRQQIGDRKLTGTQVATVRELYGLKLAAILKNVSGFNGNLERYFSSGQKDGFLRYFESVYREAVPRALRTAIQQVGISGKPGPKPGASGQPAGAVAKPGQKTAPAAGFTMLNGKPSMKDVDRVHTSTDMWLAGKAVLKDGRKVQWKTI